MKNKYGNFLTKCFFCFIREVHCFVVVPFSVTLTKQFRRLKNEKYKTMAETVLSIAMKNNHAKRFPPGIDWGAKMIFVQAISSPRVSKELNILF